MNLKHRVLRKHRANKWCSYHMTYGRTRRFYIDVTSEFLRSDGLYHHAHYDANGIAIVHTGESYRYL